VGDRVAHPVDGDEVAICTNLPQDYADVFRFACATGVRKGQLLATTWRMVDTEGWSITWPLEVCKKQRAHTIQLANVSFVTLATLGYGDVVPVSEPARGLAIVE